MSKKIIYSLWLFLWFIVVPLQAWAMESTDDIDTNRPSFMFSPLVLPKGSIQFENGALYQHFQHGGTTVDLPETQVRVGLAKTTEFEVFVPSFVLFQPTSTDKVNGGASDLSEIGFKHQFPAIKKLQITGIAALNVPTGSIPISGTGVQPVFRVPWSYTKGNWGFMGMQSLLLINSGRNVEYEPDFMISRSYTPRKSFFFEYGGFFTHNTRPVNLAHFGYVWKVARDHQLDMQFGFGMNKTSPSAFVGVGYSFRFDNLHL